MAWEPGQSGNPQGRGSDKLFAATLKRAIAQDDGKKVRAAIDKLLDLAEAGEPWAIKELADRLDGKASQSVDLGSDPERPVLQKLIREIVRPDNKDR